MRKRRNILTVFVFLIGIIGVYILLLSFPDEEKTTVNVFTLFGTYTSTFGLIIACIQIFSLKKISEITKTEIQKTQKRISQIISVSELSKANKIIQEIQHFIVTEKNEMGLLRMRDLKEIMIQAKCSYDLHKFTESNEYNEIIQRLSDDLNNLSEFIRVKKKMNFTVLNKNLEKISTSILNYENNLKSNGYDN